MDAISFFNIIGRKDTSYSDYDKENNKALFKYKDIIFEKLKKEKLISLSKIDNTNRFFGIYTDPTLKLNSDEELRGLYEKLSLPLWKCDLTTIYIWRTI